MRQPPPHEESRAGRDGGACSVGSVLAVGGVLVGVLLIAGFVIVTRAAPGVPPDAEREPTVFAGLGAWVDVYDYAPDYQGAGSLPAVTPQDLAVMEAQGVRTLYLQTSGVRNDGPLADRELVSRFVEAAHRHGIDVVGWYAPRLVDLDEDRSRVAAAVGLETPSGGLDGFALDIEVREVSDPELRSERLVELSEDVHEMTGSTLPLGAIVPPPVLLSDVNPRFWPGFPWTELSAHYDAWLPMVYWTFRADDSPHNDPADYLASNVERLRRLVDEEAPVHALGGVGTELTLEQADEFARALADNDVAGASFYDHTSTPTGAVSVLHRELDGVGHPG